MEFVTKLNAMIVHELDTNKILVQSVINVSQIYESTEDVKDLKDEFKSILNKDKKDREELLDIKKELISDVHKLCVKYSWFRIYVHIYQQLGHK